MLEMTHDGEGAQKCCSKPSALQQFHAETNTVSAGTGDSASDNAAGGSCAGSGDVAKDDDDAAVKYNPDVAVEVEVLGVVQRARLCTSGTTLSRWPRRSMATPPSQQHPQH